MTLVKEARWTVRILSDVQNEVLHKESRALAQELWGVPMLKFATQEGALDFAKQVLTRVGGGSVPHFEGTLPYMGAQRLERHETRYAGELHLAVAPNNMKVTATRQVEVRCASTWYEAFPLECHLHLESEVVFTVH